MNFGEVIIPCDMHSGYTDGTKRHPFVILKKDTSKESHPLFQAIVAAGGFSWMNHQTILIVQPF